MIPTYKITSEQLKAVLIAVQNGKRSLPNKGICDNVEDLFLHDFEQYHTLKYQNQTLSDWFLETAKEWPSFSGDPHYPVPSPRKAIDVQLAYQRYPCWEGEYGQSRMSLLRFFIQKADMPEDCVTSDGRISFDELLDALREVKANPKRNHSICGQVEWLLDPKNLVFEDEVSETIAALAQDWEHYPRDETYLVPCPKDYLPKLKGKDKDDPHRWAFVTLPKWEGKYGKLRRALLDHLIAKLEAEP